MEDITEGVMCVNGKNDIIWVYYDGKWRNTGITYWEWVKDCELAIRGK